MKNAYNVLILSVLAPAVGLMAVACGGDDSKPTPDSTGTGGNVTYELLDDMEAPTMGAGSYGILSNGSRVGGWFIYDDGTIPAGMPGAMMFDEIALTPAHATSTAPSSTRAIHTTGGPFTGYGSGFGTNLGGDTRSTISPPTRGSRTGPSRGRPPRKTSSSFASAANTPIPAACSAPRTRPIRTTATRRSAMTTSPSPIRLPPSGSSTRTPSAISCKKTGACTRRTTWSRQSMSTRSNLRSTGQGVRHLPRRRRVHEVRQHAVPIEGALSSASRS